MKERTGALLAGSILDEQIALETKAVEAGVTRYKRLAKEAVDRGDGACLKPAERFLVHWFDPVVALIKREQEECANGTPGTGRRFYRHAMNWISAEKMAVIAMHEALGQCLLSDSGVLFVKMAYDVGNAVIAEVELQEFKDKNPEALKELTRRLKVLSAGKLNWWAKKSLETPKWHRGLCVHIGSQLLRCLLEGAHAGDYMHDTWVGAFYHERRTHLHKSIGYFCMDPRVYEQIDIAHSRRQSMRPRYLPMIVPPYPWRDGVEGGYVRIRTPFMSKPSQEQKRALRNADLTKIYAANNALGSTPWSINAGVYQAQQDVWAAGGNQIGIPPTDDLPMPPKAESEDKVVIAHAKRERVKVYEKNVENKSLRVEFVCRHDVAKMMLDRPAIYFPHQMDFRGRSMPIPPHLNHHGDDVARGLLSFSREVRCTAVGSRELMIHAANCYGHDKLPFPDRVKFITDNLQQVASNAENPLDSEWWTKAENPWQFLAACQALMAPKLAAKLPVQLDGTCNGLQHYSAIGRDPVGAASVNMIDSESPSDVYSDVMREVRSLVSDDIENEKSVSEVARRVLPYVNRTLVKQPVMTSVYGVTFVGARNQIWDRLREAGMPKEQVFESVQYLVRRVMTAISRVCIGASEIMAWLKQCARIIAKAGLPISWITPLDLIVVQPYRNYAPLRIVTVVQEIHVPNEDRPLGIKASKQISSFAPNFIHSIDATHMLMTATACQEEGIDFAEVHDSFWTHAEHAPILARILREQFVKLHEMDILDDLVTQFRGTYPGLEFQDPPARGSFDVSNVLKSRHFFM